MSIFEFFLCNGCIKVVNQTSGIYFLTFYYFRFLFIFVWYLNITSSILFKAFWWFFPFSAHDFNHWYFFIFYLNPCIKVFCISFITNMCEEDSGETVDSTNHSRRSQNLAHIIICCMWIPCMCFFVIHEAVPVIFQQILLSHHQVDWYYYCLNLSKHHCNSFKGQKGIYMQNSTKKKLSYHILKNLRNNMCVCVCLCWK